MSFTIECGQCASLLALGKVPRTCCEANLTRNKSLVRVTNVFYTSHVSVAWQRYVLMFPSAAEKASDSLGDPDPVGVGSYRARLCVVNA